MTNKTLVDWTAVTTLADSDILWIVTDPGGDPEDHYITYENLRTTLFQPAPTSLGGGATNSIMFGTKDVQGRFIFNSYWAADANGPGLLLFKSRGATIGTYTYPNSGDILGNFGMGGAAASSMAQSGGMYGMAGSTWTSTNHDTYLSFRTTPAGSTTITERVRMLAAGGISIQDGVTAPGAVSGWATIYVDSGNSDLRIKYGDGTIKVIVAKA